MKLTRLEFYESANVRGGPQWWRWRVKAGNGRIIGASSEGYARKIDARRNAKQLAAVIAALLTLTGCGTLKRPEEIAWQSLHLIDMAQTADGMEDSCVREGHPLTRQVIGAKPSTGEIVAYGAAASIVHATISDLLRERSPTGYKVWQAVSLIDTGYAVHKNYSIGIRLGGPNKTGCAS